MDLTTLMMTHTKLWHYAILLSLCVWKRMHNENKRILILTMAVKTQQWDAAIMKTFVLFLLAIENIPHFPQ